MLSSSRDTAYLWDKILRVTLKPGEYEILSSVNLRRKKYKLRMLFCSGNLGVYTQMRGVHTQTKYGYWKTESYEWFRQFRRSVSQRHLPRETESMRKRSFTPSNVDSRRKGSSGKGMKGGCKEAHKTTTRKVHFVGLMDIREFESTCTLPRSVRKKNIISSREK